MSAPRLFSVWFDVGTEFPTTGDWRRMASVLEWSARKHAPGWTVDVRRVTPDTAIKPAIYERGITVNARKMRIWCEQVEEARDGDRLLFVDGDTFVVGSLDPLWETEFDVAVTVREGVRLPLNGGVIGVRVNDRSRAWFALLWKTHERMIADRAFHTTWRKTHAGINQAALGYVLAQPPVCDIARLRCVEWNCEDSSWQRYDPARTRIIHAKSKLRQAIFPEDRTTKPRVSPRRNAWQAHHLMPLVSLWKSLEAESKRQEAAA